MGCGASTVAGAPQSTAAESNATSAAQESTPAAKAPVRCRKGSVMDEIDALEDDVTIVLNVQAWLESIGMAEEYWPKFEAAGYDDLEIMADLKEDELKQDIGVEKVGHVRKLIKAIQKLKSARRASSVSDITSPNVGKSAVKPGSKPLRMRKGSVDAEIEALDGSFNEVRQMITALVLSDML